MTNQDGCRGNPLPGYSAVDQGAPWRTGILLERHRSAESSGLCPCPCPGSSSESSSCHSGCRKGGSPGAGHSFDNDEDERGVLDVTTSSDDRHGQPEPCGNPYLLGVLLGLVLLASFAILGSGPAASGAIARLGAALLMGVAPSHSDRLAVPRRCALVEATTIWPAGDQIAGFCQRCGSSSSMRPLGWLGRRSSTSRK